ncbi:MAG TPA: hypothetical protein VM692_15000, partial [Gammaproteobacteria bacterium]|nr:hypothetical protein [Gammaproteobacteria bacterium]
MRTSRWLLLSLVAVAAAHGYRVGAQDRDDDDDDKGRDDRDVTCSNGLGDVQIRGDLAIASRCTLNGTDVRGNVTL